MAHAQIQRIHYTVIVRNVQEYSRLLGNMADYLHCYGDKRTLLAHLKGHCLLFP